MKKPTNGDQITSQDEMVPLGDGGSNEAPLRVSQGYIPPNASTSSMDGSVRPCKNSANKAIHGRLLENERDMMRASIGIRE